jgi:hypothetical protein
MDQQVEFDAQARAEYEDWLREQDRLSDDKYGIVCARDTDCEYN